MQKAQTEAQGSTSSIIHEDGSVTLEGESSTLAPKDADDDASTKGVRSTAGSPKEDADVEAVTNGIPTIRISTESNRERAKTDAENDDSLTNGAKESGRSEVPSNALEKPVQAAGGDGNQDETTTQAGLAQQEAFSFSNKRLCERWLDNLFMVLYEVS